MGSAISTRTGINSDFDKLDIPGVVSGTAIWQYMRYGKSLFQIYNDVDRAFYESILINQLKGYSLEESIKFYSEEFIRKIKFPKKAGGDLE